MSIVAIRRALAFDVRVEVATTMGKRDSMPVDSDASATGDGAAGARQPLDAASTPTDLKVKIKEQRLGIEWSDGTHSDFLLAELRRRCPCASCRIEREERESNPLHILKSDPSGVRVTHAQLVGRYAIQFTWSDGHDTGIFDFRFLRSLQEETTPVPPNGGGAPS